MKALLKKANIEYYRIDNYIELRLKSENSIIDVQKFAIKNEKEQRRFFDYVCNKLGLNFKKFQKEKDTEYY